MTPEWISPRPCSGRLVMAPVPGGRVPAATLTTVWETDRIPFKRATSFLEPVALAEVLRLLVHDDEAQGGGGRRGTSPTTRS